MDNGAPSFPEQNRLLAVLRQGKWALVIGVMVGLAGMIWTATGVSQGWRLRWHGLQATGTVLNLRSERHWYAKYPVDFADYLFVADGVAHRSTEPITTDFTVGRSIPGPVVVAYLSDDPSVSEIKAGTHLISALVRFGLAFALAYVCAVVLGSRKERAKVAAQVTQENHDP